MKNRSIDCHCRVVPRSRDFVQSRKNYDSRDSKLQTVTQAYLCVGIIFSVMNQIFSYIFRPSSIVYLSL